MRSSHLTKAPSTIAEVKLSDVDRSDPWETIRRGCRLISSKVGLIKQIGHGVHHSQDPNMFALGIYAADLSRWSDIQNTSKGGGGGEELVQALAATIGEVVERYCMYFFDKATMTFASYNELGDDAVSPDRLRLHSAEQTAASLGGARLDYFSENAKTYWVWGWSLTERRPRLAPAPLVYLGYGYDAKEAAIGRNASSGLAAGLTREEAILTALQELIERDAFTIVWLHRRLP